jgi:hypoxia-inducible factor prolyl hydroxylase
VGLLGNHLETYGWAVCDHTIPEDIVRRVRIEASLFTTFYEQSEIWVGKQADIGAHVAVPSVRGDKVLWMCGGHLHRASPEGLTRTVKTHGEIEPCRLDVKAKAPIRRFAAMKELIISIDKLVFELKEKCPTLSGLYERSDAMLTIYPGEGSRFAKHIDNTTQDGRKITVLCYLNPDWEESLGGALRLFIPKKFRHKEEEESMAKAKAPRTQEATAMAVGTATGGGGGDEGENPPPPATTTSSAGDYHMKAVDVYPQGGRVAIFYSSDIPHEVLPTFGNRHALTIWYYDTNERKQTLERAKESGKGSRASKASLETQQAAQQFVAKLMSSQSGAEDEEGSSSTPAAESELRELQDLVKELSDEVIEIVSNITGAPSLESFRDGFEMLTVHDLKQMRGLFQRMGLGSYRVVN